jgi:hypothetical protein
LLFGPARAAASSSYGDPAYAAGFPAILKMPREDASYLIPAANDEKVIRINSNSFNAKKRSSFSFDGDSEQPTRGLTIVHFMTAHTYEFKSFDTHASEEEAAKFIACLKTLKNNKATYVILAHDSASKSMAGFTGELKKLGFPVLGNLKSRQAYVMNNFQGAIDEKSDDLSIQSNLPVPENITKTDNLFPRQKYVFAPSVDRYIAHAGGEVNGIKSTNSKDALDQNYKKGFRLFELDIIETSDGKFVAAHDWNMWSRFTDYGDELPVSHAEFMEHRIYGKYTTLDMEGINKWFAAHPEAILVTDKVNDPIRFANTFIDKKRLIMELFSPMAIEEAVTANITAMISQKPFNQIAGDKLAYLSANDIKHVAISRRTVARNAELLKKLQKQGIKVYVYHVNFDPGKDEKYVQENEIGLVYGMYADKWAFDPGDTGKNSR